MPTTEVILTEKIENLGAEADVVKVKRGYARNFLIPRGKALEVTKTALKRLNVLKVKRAEREGKELNEAEELSRKINKLKITLELETGEQGKAFGSITANDIAERLKTELKTDIDRHRIHLERPIKETGAHEVQIKLHSDVVAKLNITVKAKSATEEPAAETKPEATESDEKSAGGFKAKVKAKHSK
ncbi:MAG: 50S ribosomal protein L9 [Verrucomicrobiaceae bacterium]|nr:MAG: 50S ribosomal protein L9 [Verrucomicrobiaceae bacterium]